MTQRTLTTPRLRLVAATVETLRAELDDRERFAALLGAAVPPGWPPGEYDADAQRFFLERLEREPGSLGWWGWYVVRAETRPTLTGAAGFLGPPDADGVVEIGFSTCPEFRRCGYTREAVSALVGFAAKEARLVIAHTGTENHGAIATLVRCGFADAGAGREPGQRRFEYQS